MGKVRLDFGAEVDLLSGAEYEDGQRHLPQAIWREYAHGLKALRLPVLAGQTTAGGVLLLGSQAQVDQTRTGPTRCGPNEGYAWRVVRVSIYGLSGTDAPALYRGEPAATTYVRGFSATATEWDTARGLLLLPGDYLTLAGSGMTDNETVTLNGEVVEAPAEQLYKLIGG